MLLHPHGYSASLWGSYRAGNASPVETGTPRRSQRERMFELFQFLALSFGFSLALLLGATELERRAIVARRLGPNGRAILLALFVSAVASLVVTVAAGISGGWIYFFHVLGASIIYHGVMGVSLVHGLQEVSARVAGHGAH